MFVMSACWAVTTPLYAAADEPAHVTKAAAVVRGQFVGKPFQGTATLVHVPVTFAHPGLAGLAATCFEFQTDRSASCQRIPRGAGEVAVPTYVGHYPPFYYLLVGWPSLLSSSLWPLYAMRLLSAAACCALLAAGLWLVLTTRQRPLVIGFFVALTPPVLFLAGTVNPSALEIAAGLCLWSAAIAWLSDKTLARPCAWIAAIAGTVFAQLRWGSLLLLLLLAITVVVLGARVQFRRWMVPIGISTVVGATWNVAAHGWGMLGPPAPPSYTTAHLITLSIGRLDGYFHELVGVFGSPTSSLTFYIWLLISGFMLFSAWATGDLRLRTALALMVLALLVVPVAMNVAEARTVGYAAGQFGVYQSRYLMPYSLGIPLVAAYGILRGGWRPPARTFMVLLGIGQTATFVQALRRYTVGAHGPILWIGGPWSPPYLGAIAPVLIFALALSGLLAGTWWISGGRDLGRLRALRSRRYLKN